MSVGAEDYCLALGVEPSADGIELRYAVSFLVTICKAVGIEGTGLVGSIAGFRDLATFEAAAEGARQLGCVGAGCIHPDQMLVLNRVFTPDPRGSAGSQATGVEANARRCLGIEAFTGGVDMDTERSVDLATVWLAEELLTEMGEHGGLLLLEQVRSGHLSLDEIGAASAETRRKQPGEFGMELAASMLVALLTAALKPFFEKYVEKLTGKLADKAADKTIELVKRTFLDDLRAGRDNVTDAIRDELELKRKTLRLSKNEVDRILKALDAKRTSRG